MGATPLVGISRYNCRPGPAPGGGGGVKPTEPAAELVAYPNPAGQTLTLTLELPATMKGAAQILLVDETGRVHQQLSTESVRPVLSVVRLPMGTYAVRVRLADSTTLSRVVQIHH